MVTHEEVVVREMTPTEILIFAIQDEDTLTTGTHTPSGHSKSLIIAK
jgi:hypothetical protein